MELGGTKNALKKKSAGKSKETIPPGLIQISHRTKITEPIRASPTQKVHVFAYPLSNNILKRSY